MNWMHSKNYKTNATSRRERPQQVIKDRDAKLEQLKEYCRDLKAIAKVAFKDKPHLLEKPGVLVRS